MGGSTGGGQEIVQRKLGGSQKRLYSVDIGADRVLCAGEDLVVRAFDFTKAADAERRMQAARSVRSARRDHRKQAAAAAVAKKPPGEGQGLDGHGRLGGVSSS